MKWGPAQASPTAEPAGPGHGPLGTLTHPPLSKATSTLLTPPQPGSGSTCQGLGGPSPCRGPGPPAASPQHQAPLDLRLHLLRHVLHIGLRSE